MIISQTLEKVEKIGLKKIFSNVRFLWTPSVVVGHKNDTKRNVVFDQTTSRTFNLKCTIYVNLITAQYVRSGAYFFNNFFCGLFINVSFRFEVKSRYQVTVCLKFVFKNKENSRTL